MREITDQKNSEYGHFSRITDYKGWLDLLKEDEFFFGRNTFTI